MTKGKKSVFICLIALAIAAALAAGGFLAYWKLPRSLDSLMRIDREELVKIEVCRYPSGTDPVELAFTDPQEMDDIFDGLEGKFVVAERNMTGNDVVRCLYQVKLYTETDRYVVSVPELNGDSLVVTSLVPWRSVKYAVAGETIDLSFLEAMDWDSAGERTDYF